MMEGYLISQDKTECTGCEACAQICPKDAIRMEEDKEKFRYPQIDKSLCIGCRLCERVCPEGNQVSFNTEKKYVFGGYSLDPKVRFESTSGGAFSAIVDAFCDNNYVIFGAKAKGLLVYHSYINDKKDLQVFRKSKYSQSIIGKSYRHTKKFLIEGKKVLFSGTPCQIAGLNNYLNLSKVNTTNLLTVEVICEGVPSPLYIEKYDEFLNRKFGYEIDSIDYRFKGKSILSHGKWDFQVMKYYLKTWGGWKGRWDFEAMRIKLKNDKAIEIDRWFNPFWSIWLKHLMSRPSCYKCPYAKQDRTADITLGDLWGVHIYCPELYGENGGSSLVIANSKKGDGIVKKAQNEMYGHELKFEDALKYQGPIRDHISMNSKRGECMNDLESDMSYEQINKKWVSKPTLKLLFQKYIWGNRQKVFVWNLTHGKRH